MRSTRVAVLVSAVLLLAACTDMVQGEASPASAPDPSPSSSAPVPSPEPPAPGPPTEGTEDRSGPGQPGAADDPAGSVHVVGLNYESNPSSARLVVSLSGSGVPEWTVAYSEPTGPDGEPVDIAGDAFLRVRVRSGSSAAGQGSSSFSISSGPVAAARTLGGADGYEEVLIGVRGGDQPFTVEALTDPGRLVVDVRGTG